MKRMTRVKARITSKCQITIPKEVREELGLRPGDDIEFVRENGTFKVERSAVESPFTRYKAYLEHLRGKDVDEMVEEMRGR